MFVNVTLPVLLTLPEKVSNWPGATGDSGQTLVNTRPGVVINGQVDDAVLVTICEVQLSLPVAVTVLLTVQASIGAVKLAVKLADAWTARLGTVKTVLGEAWLLTTVTLFKMTLPELVTIPV
jgi:hypothetical protein